MRGMLSSDVVEVRLSSSGILFDFLTSTQLVEGFEGGNERTGFLRSLSVFCWVPLSCGCTSNIPVHPRCVSVLLHLLLHAF